MTAKTCMGPVWRRRASVIMPEVSRYPRWLHFSKKSSLNSRHGVDDHIYLHALASTLVFTKSWKGRRCRMLTITFIGKSPIRLTCSSSQSVIFSHLCENFNTKRKALPELLRCVTAKGFSILNATEMQRLNAR